MRNVLAFLCLVATAMTATAADPTVTYMKSNGAQVLADYRDLLTLRNDGVNAAELAANGDRLAGMLRARGLEARVLTLGDAPPAVWASLDVPGARRTLGLYAHYDGQPVDASQWRHPPWQPVLYTGAVEAGGTLRDFPRPGDALNPEWRIYARSASDDKAAIMALLVALDSLRDQGLPPSVNLRVFLDGEEERGSPHLARYIERYRDDLEADAWLFLDGPVHSSGRPQIAYGVRGVTGAEITVYGAMRPLHSGHYGNWAPVPGQQLASLLASMKDDDGRVLIDGFYASSAAVGEAEHAAIAAAGSDEALRRELGLARTEGRGEPLLRRLLDPALTIKGLASGNTGPAARNVIPDSATAAIGIRLVKGNDPAAMLDLLEAHVRAEGFHIVRDVPDRDTRLKHAKIARVIREAGYPAARTDMALPFAREVSAAVERTGGGKPVHIPTMGGSLPLYLFTDVLGAPALILPIANHDNNQHAANENLRIGNLLYGIALYSELLRLDGAAAPDGLTHSGGKR